MNILRLLNRIFLVFLFTSPMACTAQKTFSKMADKAPSHTAWTMLLEKYVDTNGNVDYKGFKGDGLKLDAYLNSLEANAPNPKKWSTEEQLAYWINAYNAYTIKLIVDNYPVKSIKDIGGSIPFVNSPWDIKFIEISGDKLDLNNIEHGILRKYFKEPRIHFAVNCASYSCPKLRNEAYEASKLDAQLTDQAKDFLADTKKNKIGDGKSVQLSKLFSWFSGDFKQNGKSVNDFINKYSPVKIKPGADINYLDYNWQLNGK